MDSSNLVDYDEHEEKNECMNEKEAETKIDSKPNYAEMHDRTLLLSDSSM